MRPPLPLAMTFAAALLATACSSDVSLTDRLAGSGRVRGDEDAVMVYRADSMLDALPLAIGHCAHFHRSARYDRKVGDGYRFSCVAG